MEISHELISKFAKFSAVGTSGAIIDFAITYFLKEKVRINKFAANSAGFAVAATSNYIFNRIWTFDSAHPEIFVQFGKFFVISLLGLALSNFLIWILHSRNRMNFYLVKLISIGLVMIWNFTLNYLYTFALAG